MQNVNGFVCIILKLLHNHLIRIKCLFYEFQKIDIL
jgi:hypothetical protein